MSIGYLWGMLHRIEEGRTVVCGRSNARDPGQRCGGMSERGTRVRLDTGGLVPGRGRRAEAYAGSEGGPHRSLGQGHCRTPT